MRACLDVDRGALEARDIFTPDRLREQPTDPLNGRVEGCHLEGDFGTGNDELGSNERGLLIRTTSRLTGMLCTQKVLSSR